MPDSSSASLDSCILRMAFGSTSERLHGGGGRSLYPLPQNGAPGNPDSEIPHASPYGHFLRSRRPAGDSTATVDAKLQPSSIGRGTSNRGGSAQSEKYRAAIAPRSFPLFQFELLRSLLPLVRDHWNRNSLPLRFPLASWPSSTAGDKLRERRARQ